MRGLLLSVFLLLVSGLPVQASQNLKEWTILVFISGHNDLDSFGHADIKEMEKVGSSNEVNIVVQRGTLAGETTPRYYIEKSESEDTITSPVIENLPRVDMGDYKELIKFIKWGIQKYPAKRYFVDVWNHGTGWRQTPMMDMLSLNNGFQIQKPEDIGFDDLTGNFITTEQMGIVMKEAAEFAGQKIDIYGSDACLMAMAEVAAEMKDSVKYFIGSQELEPLPGWPYHMFLNKLVAKPNVEGNILGDWLTKAYDQYYYQVGNPYGTTFSVVDMSYFNELLGGLRDLSTLFANTNKKTLESIKMSAITAESFSYSDYVDLFHFLKLVYAKKDLGLDFDKIKYVLDLEKKLIPININSEIHPNAFGLSVWLPTYDGVYESHAERYSGLVFSKETNWIQFVESLQ